uniref:Mucin 5B, oligomeric mucus/gel-forming n=1 Tax=Bos taurus TaxID=9913 RepID=A0AAA9S694_BOVIN
PFTARHLTFIPPITVFPTMSPLNAAHGGRVCSTWGDFHYKTFDGDVFRFPGLCNYIFSAHCGSAYEDFNLQLRRGLLGSRPTITHIVLRSQGLVLEVSNGSVLINGWREELPYSRAGLLVERSSTYVKINIRLMLTFMWNGEDSALLELDPKYANQTCGLCGDFNGLRAVSEFYAHNTRLSPLQFGNLQKLDGPTEQCQDPLPSPAADNCTDEEGVCRRTLLGPAFAPCHGLVDTEVYVAACTQDLCRCPTCPCATFAEYSRQCAHAGGQPQNWRGPDLCPQTCPLNTQHQECGSPCVDTCSNPERSQLCEDHCVDGCFCPPDTVLDDVTHTGCLPLRQCPCTHGGRTYAPGASFNTSCTSCTCSGGLWQCQDLPCPGTCSVQGGSHISTYDEKLYDVHGDCSYVLTKVCADSALTVLAELRKCGLTDNENCLKTVTLSLNGGDTVSEIQANGGVFVNSIYSQLPMSVADVTVFRPSSFFILVQTGPWLQLQVQLVPLMQVFLRLDPAYRGQMCGLCGNFNQNQADDFRTVSGVVEATAAAFANTWKTQAACPNVKNSFEDPCSLSVENENYAQHWCSLLTRPAGPFSPCHSVISPGPFHSNCLFDTCNCEKSEDCMCAALSSYVQACAARGVLLSGWRDGVCTKYASSCPKTQSYAHVVDSCQPTCRSLSQPDVSCDVAFVPVDGCVCPRGTFLDDAGDCVPAEACPCYLRGTVLAPGEVVHDNGVVCSCVSGRLSCLGATEQSTGCVAPMVFLDCSNASADAPGAECVRSCHTLDVDCFSTHCVSGCVCPVGLLSDGSGGCVAEEDCPCMHNEAAYKPGEVIKVDCNTCTCRGRRWECSDRPCLGTCVAYGDGHFLTFDGERYGFEGSCEYTLAQDYCVGSDTANGTFRIVTENVPCGTTGVTCSKAIKIFLGSYELILHEGTHRVLQRGPGGDLPYRVRYMGIYLTVETHGGVVVSWDRKTSVIIRLRHEYKGRVCGLCGNFDDNALNDFTTRSQSVASDVLEFGNSWKFSPSCPDALAPRDPCTTNPYRRSWAQKQCSIINSATFSACRSQVDPTRYYEACVSDACACDSGGDCECFCTAVAAYAQACHEAGVCVSWRTPDVCPLFCDYYNPHGQCEWHYQPCGAPCLKTCRNPSGLCLMDLPGLEGCYPKCPSSKPFFNEDQMECVAQCSGCYDGDGNYYDAGTRVPSTENCQSCDCTSSGLQCTHTCTCTYEGRTYAYGDVIYNTTDGLGACLIAICRDNGTIVRRAVECPGTLFKTPFTFTSTAAPPSTTGLVPTPSTVCVRKVCHWSDWYDGGHPEPGMSGGDFETFENLRQRGYQVCLAPVDIECQAQLLPGIPLEELGQKVECSRDKGLTCFNSEQSPPLCLNYKLRVLCCDYVPCGTSQPPSSQTTPTTGTTHPTMAVTTSQSPSTKLTTNTTPEGSSSVFPATTTCEPHCHWTEWFDVDYPKYEEGGGDLETYEKIRGAGGAVCKQPQEIECEAENYPGLTPEQVGQQVHCDVRFGLVCRNDEQLGLFKMCYNYRMRVLCCEYNHCTLPTATTSPTATATASTATAAAVPTATVPTATTATVPTATVPTATTAAVPTATASTATAATATTATVPMTTSSIATATTATARTPTVPTATTTVTVPTATTVTVPTATSTTATISTAATSNATAPTAAVHPETSTPAPTTATTGATTSQGTTSCQPKCKWTEWFDVDYPKYEEGGGDFETYEKIRGAGGAVCKQPQEIECEAENYPGLTPEQVGQRVHCDVHFGLVCRNDEQLGLFKMCYNYRMRVLCCEYNHSTTSTVPTVTATTETVSTATASTATAATATTTGTATTATVPTATTATVPMATTSTATATVPTATTATVPTATTATVPTETTTTATVPTATTATTTTATVPRATTSTATATTATTATVPKATTATVPMAATSTAIVPRATTATATTTTVPTATTSTATAVTATTATVPTATTTTATISTAATSNATAPTAAVVTATTSTPAPTTATTGATTSQGMTSCQPKCKWTEWFDVDYPKYEEGGGDFETYEKIRGAGGAVCKQPQEIECEAENYPGLTPEQVGQRVHCDVHFGLVCRNDEQLGLFKMCYNYRMRVLCCEYNHSTMVTVPTATTSTATMPTATMATVPMATPSTSTATVPTTSTATTTVPIATTTTATVPTENATTVTVSIATPSTAPGTTTTAPTATVPTATTTTATVPTATTATVPTATATSATVPSATTATVPTTTASIATATTVTAPTSTVPTATTSTATAVTATTATVPTATTATVPTATTATVTTRTPSTQHPETSTPAPTTATTGATTSQGMTSCQPRCKWTEWFDVDYPKYEEGGGDFETYEKIRGAGGAVCKQPQEIECEAENYPGLTPEQVGQRVHCDVHLGLVCRNDEQLGLFKMCYNYRMRVLCCEYNHCTLPTATTSPTATATASTATAGTATVPTATTATTTTATVPTATTATVPTATPATTTSATVPTATTATIATVPTATTTTVPMATTATMPTATTATVPTATTVTTTTATVPTATTATVPTATTATVPTATTTTATVPTATTATVPTATSSTSTTTVPMATTYTATAGTATTAEVPMATTTTAIVPTATTAAVPTATTTTATVRTAATSTATVPTATTATVPTATTATVPTATTTTATVPTATTATVPTATSSTASAATATTAEVPMATTTTAIVPTATTATVPTATTTIATVPTATTATTSTATVPTATTATVPTATTASVPMATTATVPSATTSTATISTAATSNATAPTAAVVTATVPTAAISTGTVPTASAASSTTSTAVPTPTQTRTQTGSTVVTGSPASSATPVPALSTRLTTQVTASSPGQTGTHPTSPPGSTGSTSPGTAMSVLPTQKTSQGPTSVSATTQTSTAWPPTETALSTTRTPSTQHPETSTPAPTTATTGATTSQGTTSCQPKCKWTEWFDVDYPKYEEGGGDFETYEKIRGAGGAVCKQPQEIECEAENYPGLTPEQVGQQVHCDIRLGLVCRNDEQLGLFKMCYNYRMRVLCCEYNHCTLPTATTSPTATATASTATAATATVPTATPATTTSATVPTATTATIATVPTATTTTVPMATTATVPTATTATVPTATTTTATVPTATTATVPTATTATTTTATVPTATIATVPTATATTATVPTATTATTTTATVPTATTATVPMATSSTATTTVPMATTYTATAGTATTAEVPMATTTTAIVPTATTAAVPTATTTTATVPTATTTIATVPTATTATTSTATVPTATSATVPTATTASVPMATTATVPSATTSTATISIAATSNATAPTAAVVTATVPTAAISTGTVPTASAASSTTSTAVPTPTQTRTQTGSTVVTGSPASSATPVPALSTRLTTQVTASSPGHTGTHPTSLPGSTGSTSPGTATSVLLTQKTSQGPTSVLATTQTSTARLPTEIALSTTYTRSTQQPETSTPAPTTATTGATTSQGTTSCQPKCKWTEWFDVDFPTSGVMGGDIETYDNIRAAGGKMCQDPEKIECRAENYPEVSIDQIGQVLNCSLETGLVCRNEDQRGPFTMCFNYNIRVYCCDDVRHCPTTATPGLRSTSLPPVTVVTSHILESTSVTNLPPSPVMPTTRSTTCERRCAWTDWMDKSYPMPGAYGGDYETYANIQAAGGAICEQPLKLECRAEELPDIPLPDLGQVVLCQLEVGLVCRNQDQSGQMCLNYQIRLLCCDKSYCPSTAITTSTPTSETGLSSTVTTGRVSIPTSVTGPSSTVTTERVSTPMSLPGPSSMVTSGVVSTTTSVTGPSSKATTKRVSTQTSGSLMPSIVPTTSPGPTTPCLCHAFGKFFLPGDIVYNKTDGAGCPFLAICNQRCDLDRFQGACTTSSPPGTSASVPPTTPLSDCDRTIPPRKVNESWFLEDCTVARCEGDNRVTLLGPRPMSSITCVNGHLPVKVQNQSHRCDYHYECECVCSGWGDTHYETFDGTSYSFWDNCTYVLMREIQPRHGNLRILLHNRFCEATAHCPRALSIHYQSVDIVLSTTSSAILLDQTRMRQSFSKNGVIVTLTGATGMRVDIPAVGVGITFNGRVFQARLSYSRFSHNTEGQCGTCTNNRRDECRRPDGTTARTCRDMARSWLVSNSSVEGCGVPTGLPPTTSPLLPETSTPAIHPSCPPEPLCELMLSSVFAGCHSLIPPGPYFNACVSDSCWPGRGRKVLCQSLEAYAELCRSRGVCPDWRNATHGLCDLTCPSAKVYKSCGPVQPESCDSRSQSPLSVGLAEGCFCPDGHILFNSHRDICVPECPCVGPDGLPKFPGERWVSNCQDCVCDNGTVSVQCTPVECLAPDQPQQCGRAGFVAVSRPLADNPCCMENLCVCNASTCPQSPPACRLGEKLVRTQVEDDCCPTFSCEPLLCTFNGTFYGVRAPCPGVTPCHTCTCLSMDSEDLTVRCEEEACNTTCLQGFEYSTVAGQCCGECVQTACLAPDGQLVQLNETWVNSLVDNCTEYHCQARDGPPMLTPMPVVCPDVSTCKGILKKIGCCYYCVQTDACQVHTNMTVLRHRGCVTQAAVKVSFCEGSCPKVSRYSMEAQARQCSCSCCQETRTHQEVVTMQCPDGTAFQHTYTHVDECSCVPACASSPQTLEDSSSTFPVLGFTTV